MGKSQIVFRLFDNILYQNNNGVTKLKYLRKENMSHKSDI